MPITEQDFGFQLDHSRGGAGFVIIQDLGDEMFKVAVATKDGLAMDHAFLAWGNMMKRWQRPVDPKQPDGEQQEFPLTASQLEQQAEAMKMLAEGKLKIIDQRIVKA